MEIKKEILYRSLHRGCKETDHLIGKFVEVKIDDFSENELSLIRDFILEDDLLIYDWIMAKVECPKKYTKIINKIQEFHHIN